MQEGVAGTVALVGSGEFLPPIEDLDRALLARVRGPARVVIVPTAAAPDGPGVPERWAQMGVEHFTRLGAAVEGVLVRTRAEAESAELAERIAAANFVYLSGGKPQYLRATLHGTACWRAIAGVHAAGGVVAGCSAGAMALAGRLVAWPWLWRTQPALGLAPGLLVIPHFDEIPHWITRIMRRVRVREAIVGIDGSTALVGGVGAWRVAGHGGVTVLARRGQVRYAAGAPVPLRGGTIWKK